QTSAWHVVSSAELWLWHRGGPLTLSLAGTGEEPADDPQQVVLGVGAGQSPQALVPAGTWQRATASATVETLVSCVVSPGFAFADVGAVWRGPSGAASLPARRPGPPGGRRPGAGAAAAGAGSPTPRRRPSQRS